MNNTLKNTIVIIALAIGIILAWKLKIIVGYLLISLVLALIGRPLMKLLSRIKIKNKKLPVGLNSFITIIALMVFFTAFFSIFAPLVVTEARIISSINFEEVAIGIAEPISDLESWMTEKHFLSPDSDIQSKLSELFSLTKVSTIFNSLIGFLGNGLIALFSILFITFFMLKEKGLTKLVVESFTPNDKIEKVNAVTKNIKRLLSRYFIGVIIQITLITVIVSLGLTFLGIENAILIGFLAGLINVIPYVGPLFGAIIGILIGISTNLELDFYTQILPLSFKIISIFAVMQIIDNFVFQPLIFSNSVKAHPLEIFLIILSAGTLWGITGMIIAIPFYTIFRVIAKEFLSEFKIVKELTKNI
jgi:predicted PurR-regulated permease PerM